MTALAACPACGGAALAVERTSTSAPADSVLLHLPDVTCAACIVTVEETLAKVPGVTDARVNLTRKQATVSGAALEPGRLIAALAAVGHRAQELDTSILAGRSDELRGLLLRTGVAGFAMMNVMLLSVAVWSGAADNTKTLFHLISAAITLPAIAFSGRPFFASALRALRARRLNMDVPISLAILLATLVSFVGAVQGSDRASWFDAALALTFFLLIGRTLDHAGRAAARSAAAELSALNVPQALRLVGDRQEVVKAESLVPGDLVLVRPGDRFPADGMVEEGSSDVDRSALTGESVPVPVEAGAEVSAGEMNLSGALTLRVARAGQDTALSRLSELVANAETQRTRFASLADRAAASYAPSVHLLGAASFLSWWVLGGDVWQAVQVAISVLVITCPCALGLAVPAVSVVATGRLFRKGLLVKSRTALERMSQIDLVAFDKTGTLTTGEAQLVGAAQADDLALAASLAALSAHPYSRSLVMAADARGLPRVALAEMTERPGLGIEARIGRRTVRLGRPAWIGAAGEGVALDRGDGAPVLFRFEERLRPEAAEVVARLTRAGAAVVMLSGDTEAPCRRVAEQLGISQWHSTMTPQGKADWVGAEKAAGRHVLMVGDGLNDTGALAVAEASVAIGTGLDAARSAADVVLLSGGLTGLPDLIAISRNAVSRMRQNIWLSLGYNVIAVPVALAGLATPLLAALAMSLSSVTVSLNAMRRLD